ncbi:MAG TPA: hypothetical protein VKB79_23850 [Bryobacteraceae bacterium]|nr:hypothetical protein [Bryobacteraceae bacterium]
MKAWVVCAATPTSGIRHRFRMLSAVKSYAEKYRCEVALLWGATRGVAHCRFAELLAPVRGVVVHDVLREHLSEIERISRNGDRIRLGNLDFQIFRPERKPIGNVFSWDLRCASALGDLGPRPWKQIVARPAAPIRREADAFARAYAISQRIGIRVRVDEIDSGRRKPHRLQRELDDVVKSIIRIPWYAKVFVVTDSEYIQQMLASHFADCVFVPKNFDLTQSTGRYVHRQDKAAMVTFLKEVDCLCRCRKIIDIGGFLNDASVRHKIVGPPYDDAVLMQLTYRQPV